MNKFYPALFILLSLIKVQTFAQPNIDSTLESIEFLNSEQFYDKVDSALVSIEKYHTNFSDDQKIKYYLCLSEVYDYWFQLHPAYYYLNKSTSISERNNNHERTFNLRLEKLDFLKQMNARFNPENNKDHNYIKHIRIVTKQLKNTWNQIPNYSDSKSFQRISNYYRTTID